MPDEALIEHTGSNATTWPLTPRWKEAMRLRCYQCSFSVIIPRGGSLASGYLMLGWHKERNHA